MYFFLHRKAHRENEVNTASLYLVSSSTLRERSLNFSFLNLNKRKVKFPLNWFAINQSIISFLEILIFARFYSLIHFYGHFVGASACESLVPRNLVRKLTVFIYLIIHVLILVLNILSI